MIRKKLVNGAIVQLESFETDETIPGKLSILLGGLVIFSILGGLAVLGFCL